MAGQSKNVKRLTVKERQFFRAYIKLGNITEAYHKIKPDVTDSSAASLGTRLLQRIKAKADFEELLEAAGLGYARLLEEVEKGLNAEMVKHWQGEEIGVYEDNTIRQRARELLADLLGARKQKLDLNHSADKSLVDILAEAHNERRDAGSDQALPPRAG